MSTIEEKVQARIKCKAYKNKDNPDDRMSLCGEPVQTDKKGRQFFVIPGHQREYLKKLLPSYEFGESYDIADEPKAKAPGRAITTGTIVSDEPNKGTIISDEE